MYRTRAEQFAAVLPWVRFGIERGERCIYIADDNELGVVRESLGSLGITVGTALEPSVLLLYAKSDAFIRQDRFDLDALFAILEDLCAEAAIRGFPAIRLAGEMTWALDGNLAVEQLCEFENRLNKISTPLLRSMCQFNLDRFGSEILGEIVRVHPHIIFEGKSYHNSQFSSAMPGFARPTASTSAVHNRLLDEFSPKASLAQGPARADVEGWQEPIPHSLLLESIPAGVLLTDGDGLITYANARAEGILRTARRELCGRSFETQKWCVKNINGTAIADDCLPTSRVRNTGLAEFDDRLVLEWSQESRTYVSMSAAPLGYVGGRPKGTVVLITDISERAATEAQNQKKQMELSQFQRMEAIATLAGGIAHDFNNLLGGILACTSVMDLQLGDQFRFHEDLSEIKALVERGAELTRQLLGFAHRGKYVPTSVDLNAIVNELSASFGRTRKDICIEINCSSADAFVSADKTQIQQLLVNLLLNARQAMPSGGNITLGTDNVYFSDADVAVHGVAPGRYIKLSVSDTGIGMSESTQERIFEPFFTTRQFGQGAGLGLASVFGIVKNHGGFITVQSELGRGSTFTICLPAMDNWSIKAPARSRQWQLPQAAVLVVDDEPYILRSSQRMLMAMGYPVLTARGGREAIDVFRRNPQGVALVILDMTMPHMNGRDTFEALREIEPNVKVLLCSGYSAEGEASEVLQRGGIGFIQKPFDSATLSAKLLELI
jgi:signal transduction histidine kinase